MFAGSGRKLYDDSDVILMYIHICIDIIEKNFVVTVIGKTLWYTIVNNS